MVFSANLLLHASCLDRNHLSPHTKSFSYSNTLGWNTFPVPPLTDQNKAALTRCAEDILLAREAHFPATIADLYDPETMPANLRAAHEANDEMLERIYMGRRFRNDTERLETLFVMYAKMTAGEKGKTKRGSPSGMTARKTKGKSKTQIPFGNDNQGTDHRAEVQA